MKSRTILLVALYCAVMMVASPVFATQLVETDAIADGAVTDAKISGVISSSKLDGSTLDVDTVDGKHAADFADAVHAHGTADIAGLQAELDAKANYAELATKADISHTHASSSHANVIVVAKSGGDFNDPVAALNSITDASDTNPYLVKIMPGIYDITESLSVKSYVHVVGSGIEATKIRGSISTAGGSGYGVALFTHSSLESLSVEQTGEGWNFGVYLVSGYQKVENVKIYVSGGYRNTGLRMQSNQIELATLNKVTSIANGTDADAIGTGMEIAESPRNAIITNSEAIAIGEGGNYGIIINGPWHDPAYQTVDLRHMKIVATGGVSNTGLYLRFSNVNLVDSTIEVSGGSISNTAISSVDTNKSHIDRSIVVSSSYAVLKSDTDNMYIGGSRLEGNVLSSAGILKCATTYDGNYDLLDSTCQ